MPSAKHHRSVGRVADLRAGGLWFDPRLGQYSFQGLMIVIATGFIPLSPLSVVIATGFIPLSPLSVVIATGFIPLSPLSVVIATGFIPLTTVRCFDNDYVGKQPVAWKNIVQSIG